MRLSINLASRRHVNQRATRLIFWIFSAFLLALLVWQGNLYVQDYRLAATYRSHMEELKAQLQGEQSERIDPEVIAQQQKAYDLAERLIIRDSFRWTGLFDRMEALLPKGVSLLSFNPNYAEESLSISGLAKDLKALQALLDNLQDEKFEPVYLNSQAQVEVDNGRGGKRNALTFAISLGKVF